MYINGDSNTTNEKKAYFDKDGVQLNMSNDDYPVYENAAIPSCFSLLRDMSETLAKPFPFVRVDWYLNKNDIIFGELTFTPEGGLNKFSPKEWDKKLGELLDLSELVNNKKNGKRKS